MLDYNPIADCDSYKLSHWKFYPKGTKFVYSYLESRGGQYEETPFFGAQGLIKQYLTTPFTKEHIQEVEEISAEHFGTKKMFNRTGFDYILNKHGGYWPVEIKAVPEGTIVPYKNVLMTVENTDENCPFTTSFLETMDLRLWYPITVAARCLAVKRKLKPIFHQYSDNPEDVDFAFHNFGDRGATSYDSAMIAGAAHLLLFKGTDAFPSLRYLRRLYNAGVSGYSVAATEHSIMCSYKESNEFESFERIIEEAEEGTIISVVSDTWNIFRACEMWVKLADRIKEKNLTLVVRPDSGDIKAVLPKVLLILINGFGVRLNSKGLNVLKNVKVLWGDGMNEETVTEPFLIALGMGIAPDSIVTGAGGGTVQNGLNRDTNKFATKASNVIVGDEEYGIAKDPITDPGKQSKMGRMSLVDGSVWGKLVTVTGSDTVNGNILRPIFRNGELLIDEDFATMRNRIIL